MDTDEDKTPPEAPEPVTPPAARHTEDVIPPELRPHRW